MAKASEPKKKFPFRRSLFGYKKRDVTEYVTRMKQEHATAEANYRERIALLVQESEHAAQALQALQVDRDHLVSDNNEYKRQLKDSAETVRVLYERLDLLGEETESLQRELSDLKKTVNLNDPTLDEWKARALTAEETVRRLAESELRIETERKIPKPSRFAFWKKSTSDSYSS